MYTDIHSHIIPEVDDGACNIEEALKLLSVMGEQGITSVIATPHFYASKSVLSPKEHRIFVENKLKLLKDAAGDGLPKIHLGHEVHYFKDIANCEEISELCISGTNYLLLELPYSKINSNIPAEIVELSLNFGIKPILAHIERYMHQPEFNNILSVIKDGFAKGQINCDSLVDKPFRRTSIQLIKKGLVSYLATDAHNISNRPPKFTEAYGVISKKLGRDTAERLCHNSNSLLKEIED